MPRKTGKSNPAQEMRPGDLARNSIDSFGKALDVLADRVRVEPSFTPDLDPAREPILRALKTLGETFQQLARERLETLSEKGLKDTDDSLRSLGVPDMLEAAVALGGPPEGKPPRPKPPEGNPEILIPGIDIIKEIIHFVKKLFGLSGPIIDGIDEVLKLINKLLKGKPLQ